MQKKRIVILGAGISGLSLAWYLRKQLGRTAEITILEKSRRAGGWIQTIHKEEFLFEQGPRSCRTVGNGLATLQLIEDLGLQEKVIVASPAARQRYIYANQQLQRLPTSPLSLVFSPLLPLFVKSLWKDMREPSGNEIDESIFNFVSRRLGTEVAEKFIDPLVTGIYAGDIRKLSVKCCFPALYNWEKQHGSLLKGMILRKKKKDEEVSEFIKLIREHSVFTLQDGMETLIQALVKALPKELKLSTQVESLKINKDNIGVHTSELGIIHADHVFSTLPPHELGRLIREADGKLSKHLQSIRSTSVAVINLGYKQKVLPCEGFGYLVPSKEKEEILGTVWDSSAFAQQNHSPDETRLTVMLGGEHMPDFHNYKESDFLGMALRSMAKHLNINREPDALSIKVAAHAIPQYEIGHAEFVKEVRSQLSSISEKITITGSGFDGVSVNDCIFHSKSLSKASFEHNTVTQTS
jgi:protoporphyrinogen/coproporphyrinogen III oxidase